MIQLIAQAGGYQGMIEGQMRDILSEGKQLTVDDLKSSHTLKTGALIHAAIETGAILAGGNPQQVNTLNEYANDIGLAFQVADDILNVEGDPDRMGKAVGTDAARQKNTYPALLGLEASKVLAGDLVCHALQTLDLFDHSADPLRAIAKYIIERKR
jgi:geranylgeranyl diphosphate synthase type II